MVPSTIIKAMLFSTGITAMSLFLKSYIPIALDFSISRFPIIWSSFLSWLKPPYLFVVTNVIITIIISSSRYYQSIGDYDGDDDEILHDCDQKIQTDQQIVHQSPPPPMFVSEMERSEIFCEEKEEDVSGPINRGDEFVVLKSEGNQRPSMIDESESLPPAEKPMVSARSGHREPVKSSPKGGSRKKALRVVKPKQHETVESAWKMITKGKSTPLTSHYRRPSTSGIGAGGDVKPALGKAETFRDVTNYRQSPRVTPPVKMKKEMSPSREELNRRVEAFIKKCKEERLVSLRLEKEVARREV